MNKAVALLVEVFMKFLFTFVGSLSLLPVVLPTLYVLFIFVPTSCFLYNSLTPTAVGIAPV